MKVDFIYIWAAGFLILLLASLLFISCSIRNRYYNDFMDKNKDIEKAKKIKKANER